MPGWVLLLTTAKAEFSRKIWEEAKHLRRIYVHVAYVSICRFYLTGNYLQVKHFQCAQFLLASQTSFQVPLSFFLPCVNIKHRCPKFRSCLCHLVIYPALCFGFIFLDFFCNSVPNFKRKGSSPSNEEMVSKYKIIIKCDRSNE